MPMNKNEQSHNVLIKYLSFLAESYAGPWIEALSNLLAVAVSIAFILVLSSEEPFNLFLVLKSSLFGFIFSFVTALIAILIRRRLRQGL